MLEGMGALAALVGIAVVVIAVGVKLFAASAAFWVLDKTRPKGVEQKDDVIGPGRFLLALTVPVVFIVAAWVALMSF